jgi:hypothetical protein
MSAIPPKADMETITQRVDLLACTDHDANAVRRERVRYDLVRVPPLVPATTTMPSNASSDHNCDHHEEDGRVHAASMCDTPQAGHSKV